ncbi:hypothetical protein V7139_27970 [Neobacillus drentensis]|uniref:hypothetical protein n=1 Tax=Neobacillus drentensis TaxID=220684 RepID=UPI003000AEDE
MNWDNEKKRNGLAACPIATGFTVGGVVTASETATISAVESVLFGTTEGGTAVVAGREYFLLTF